MYSIVEHRKAALDKGEDFTVETFNYLIDRLEYCDLSLTEFTTDHILALRILISWEKSQMKKVKDDIVEHGYHWSRRDTFENVQTLIQKELDFIEDNSIIEDIEMEEQDDST